MNGPDAPTPHDGTPRVNVAAINGAAETLERAQRRIDASLAQLRQYCDAVTARWTGPAQAGYRILQARWDADAADLDITLGQIAAGLWDTGSTHSDAQLRNTSRREI